MNHRRIHSRITDSTNVQARILAQQGAEEGVVVTAEFQSMGRGRLQRSWTAPPGVNLLASYILHPPRPMEDWGGIPLVAGLAVADAIVKLTGCEPRLKWPNDVLLDECKVAGVLIEAGQTPEHAWCVIGIGLNVNQREFEGEYRHPPTSLLLATGRMTDVDAALDAVSAGLDFWYDRWSIDGTPAIVSAWKLRTDVLGSDRWIEDHSGRRAVHVVDVAPDGSLVVRTSAGDVERVYAGDLV